jgi:hypothetical protein
MEGSGRRPGAPLYHKHMGEAKGRGSQITPSRKKQNQTRLLGFAWSCSSESGLFNSLRGKNRKNVPPFRLAAARLASRGHDPARRKDITGISDFCKQLLGPDVSDLNFVFRG